MLRSATNAPRLRPLSIALAASLLLVRTSLACPARAVAAQDAPARGSSAPQAANGPRALLESASGEVRALPLTELDTSDPRQLGAQLVRFEGLERPAYGRADADVARVELHGGGRVLGLLRGGSAESLVLELLGGALLELPIEELASLAFPLRVPEEGAAHLEPAASGDRVYVFRAGGLDRIDGAVESFSDEGVRFESSLGSKLMPWGEVSALFVESLGDEPPTAPPGAAPVTVDLIDGSRLRGALVRLDGERCRLALPGGRELVVPISALSEVVVEDGTMSFLSALAPAFVEEPSPFGDELGMSWPHRIDRSVSGGSLRAGGRIWTRGLGVHAPSRIGWKLEGGWRELRGLVAVDDEVLTLSARGSVRFRIIADGEARWESPILRGGDAALAFPAIALAGVDELVLEVDVATDQHVADRADWLHMVLRR